MNAKTTQAIDLSTVFQRRHDGGIWKLETGYKNDWRCNSVGGRHPASEESLDKGTLFTVENGWSDVRPFVAAKNILEEEAREKEIFGDRAPYNQANESKRANSRVVFNNFTNKMASSSIEPAAVKAALQSYRMA